MSKKILVEFSQGKREIAVMEDKRLLFFTGDEPRDVEAEQIYLGVADRMARGMEALFVRLGPKQTGFLSFSECKAVPRSGEKILVQVKKPPVGDKAPYLTEDISFPGRYAILTPFTERISVSRKIEDGEERSRLAQLGKSLCPPNMGLVMRTESKDASMDALALDIASLKETWESVSAALSSACAPCLLRGREDALLRIIRDERGSDIQVIANDPSLLPPLPCPVSQMDHPFDLYSVRARLEKSLQRKVWLDCGGYLIIDRTEALTVIDVNSGKFLGGKAGAEDLFLKLNLEAAREIARLMRLRQMGGIILVDFVDMQREESRAAVLSAMEDALRMDPVKAVAHGFTHLGLMELTRKKTDSQIEGA